MTPTHIPKRELMVAQLFGDGFMCKEIALVMSITTDSAKSSIVRTRLRYKEQGRDCYDKLTFRKCLIEDGYLIP